MVSPPLTAKPGMILTVPSMNRSLPNTIRSVTFSPLLHATRIVLGTWSRDTARPRPRCGGEGGQAVWRVTPWNPLTNLTSWMAKRCQSSRSCCFKWSDIWGRVVAVAGATGLGAVGAAADWGKGAAIGAAERQLAP
jgi:hypothetical protein